MFQKGWYELEPADGQQLHKNISNSKIIRHQFPYGGQNIQ